jgi:hypothetical protein
MNVVCERAKIFDSMIYDDSKAVFEYFGLHRLQPAVSHTSGPKPQKILGTRHGFIASQVFTKVVEHPCR